MLPEFIPEFLFELNNYFGKYLGPKKNEADSQIKHEKAEAIRELIINSSRSKTDEEWLDMALEIGEGGA